MSDETIIPAAPVADDTTDPVTDAPAQPKTEEEEETVPAEPAA